MRGSFSEEPPPPRGHGEHVLLVVEDQDLVEVVATTLVLADYQVETTASGADMMRRLAQSRFDIVVLDATISGLMDLRRGHVTAPLDLPPVLFLAGSQTWHTLAPELGLGEKDYVTKPFRMSEVLVRVQVLLRARNPAQPNGTSSYRDLVLDDTTCQARRGPAVLDLTPSEYRLLHHFLANCERVLSKEQISRHVWGEFRPDNAIEKLISRLRVKVDRQEPALIHTRRGFGYWFGCLPGEDLVGQPYSSSQQYC
jgi:DNA-binding response OmpR family regulator